MSMPYLYEHQNPHAPRRDNGRRFHGYSSRKRQPDLIAIHTTEMLLDLDGVDGGAEKLARYQATVQRPSSYHRCGDRDSTVWLLPDEATAFGVVGYNSRTLSWAFAMNAADWSDPVKAAACEPALRRCAATLAEWCRTHRIPARVLTKAQADAGVAGITGHGILDPSRRSDPGRAFPWARLILMVQAILDGGGVFQLGQRLLGKGDFGPDVEALQRILRIEPDGDFGPATDAAVRAAQTRLHLTVDGIVGRVTLAALSVSPPTPVQEDTVQYLVTDPRAPRPQYVTDLIQKRWVQSPGELSALTAAANVKDKAPRLVRIDLPADVLDVIVTVGPVPTLAAV